MGQIPTERQDLQRVGMGESFVRPTANVAQPPAENASHPAQIDAALGIIGSNGAAAKTVPKAKPNAAPTVALSLKNVAMDALST